MMNRTLLFSFLVFTAFISFGMSQEDFSLEDLNPNSETYGQMVGPSYNLGNICIVFFGHES